MGENITVDTLKEKIIKHMISTLSWEVYNRGDYGDTRNKITVENFISMARSLDFITKEDEENCLDCIYDIKTYGNIRKANFMLADALIKYIDTNLQKGDY